MPVSPPRWGHLRTRKRSQLKKASRNVITFVEKNVWVRSVAVRREGVDLFLPDGTSLTRDALVDFFECRYLTGALRDSDDELPSQGVCLRYIYGSVAAS